MKLIASVLPLFVMPVLAHAADGVAETGGSIVQMILGMLVVLAMLAGTLWLLKRLALPRGPGSGMMKVIAGTPVGPRERVVILEVGSTWLVLGVAPGRVSALAEVPRQELPADIPGEAGKDFPGWLKQVIDKRNAPKS
jgi:flagellar protein FliO/FliZ